MSQSLIPPDMPEWESISPSVLPIGLMSPADIQLDDRKELSQIFSIAAKTLNDPLQVRQLAERVYQLMQEDLQLQRERGGGYGGRC